MCLVKTHRLPKISRKPIRVYKIIQHMGSLLVTPYQLHVCKVGETIKSKHSWIKGILKNEIREEGVHACITHADALVMSKHYFNHYVYLCEIPPFTPYWIGNCNDIAASKMIIKEKVV